MVRWRTSNCNIPACAQMKSSFKCQNIARLNYDGQLARDILKYSLSNAATCKNDPQMLSTRTALLLMAKATYPCRGNCANLLETPSVSLPWSGLSHSLTQCKLSAAFVEQKCMKWKEHKLLRTCVYLDHNSRRSGEQNTSLIVDMLPFGQKSSCCRCCCRRVRRSVYDAPLHSSLAKNNLQRQRRCWSRCCTYTRQIAKRANIYDPRDVYFDCRPFLNGNNRSHTPGPAWWDHMCLKCAWVVIWFLLPSLLMLHINDY